MEQREQWRDARGARMAEELCDPDDMLRRIANTLLTLFRSVTQRSEERRAMR